MFTGTLGIHSEPANAYTPVSVIGYTPQRTNPAAREAPSLENAQLYVFKRGEMKPTVKAAEQGEKKENTRSSAPDARYIYWGAGG